jgi:hypothetical protein
MVRVWLLKEPKAKPKVPVKKKIKENVSDVYFTKEYGYTFHLIPLLQ